MSVPLQPVLTIGDEPVHCRAAELESHPVAIEGLEVTWGRTDYLNRGSEPGQCRLWLMDTTTTWARRIRSRSAIGLPVELRVGGLRVFRGRITAATATPDGRQTTAGRPWWRISIVAADRTADLGNEIVTEDWPAESAVARAVRIRDLTNRANTDLYAVWIDPSVFDQSMSALEVRDQSVLELVNKLYESLGAYGWSHDPNTRAIHQAYRLAGHVTVHLATFDDATRGAVTLVAGDMDTPGNADGPFHRRGIGMHGCALASDVQLTADGTNAINRVRASFKDLAGQEGAEQFQQLRADDGPRALTFETWLTQRRDVNTAVMNAWTRATAEGARPRHPTVRLHAGHELATTRERDWWFSWFQSGAPAYIAGDMAHAWLMGDDAGQWPPVMAAIGGTAAFDPRRGWSLEVSLAWIANTGPDIAPPSWASLRQVATTTQTVDVPWWHKLLGRPTPPPVKVNTPLPARDIRWGPPDPATAQHRFAPSVTWGDLRYVTHTQIEDRIH